MAYETRNGATPCPLGRPAGLAGVKRGPGGARRKTRR
jgi:hypothetical protein